MKIPFAKYHGAGNDFVIIDSRDLTLKTDLARFARLVCRRQEGIGADGLILLCTSTVADHKMRIFNADGSEAAMCGNGIRCLFDFVQKPGFTPLNIETLCGVLTCRRNGEHIAVNLGVPKILHWPLTLPQGEVFVVDTGVPHAVLFAEDLETVNVNEIGQKIRFSPHFAPHGVNVNFVSVVEEGKIALRTYERGVEAETLSCGTGAAAAAFVVMKQHDVPSPISTLTRRSFDQTPVQYRQDLRFQFHENQIEMLGPAEEVFQGIIDLTMVPVVNHEAWNCPKS